MVVKDIMDDLGETTRKVSSKFCVDIFIKRMGGSSWGYLEDRIIPDTLDLLGEPSGSYSESLRHYLFFVSDIKVCYMVTKHYIQTDIHYSNYIRFC